MFSSIKGVMIYVLNLDKTLLPWYCGKISVYNIILISLKQYTLIVYTI